MSYVTLPEWTLQIMIEEIIVWASGETDLGETATENGEEVVDVTVVAAGEGTV